MANTFECTFESTLEKESKRHKIPCMSSMLSHGYVKNMNCRRAAQERKW